jgi:hypothetical protein
MCSAGEVSLLRFAEAIRLLFFFHNHTEGRRESARCGTLTSSQLDPSSVLSDPFLQTTLYTPWDFNSTCSICALRFCHLASPVIVADKLHYVFLLHNMNTWLHYYYFQHRCIAWYIACPHFRMKYRFHHSPENSEGKKEWTDGRTDGRRWKWVEMGHNSKVSRVFSHSFAKKSAISWNAKNRNKNCGMGDVRTWKASLVTQENSFYF